MEDDYTVLEKLGEGSFGKVFKVLSKKDGENYALKQVNYNEDK
uniref:Protein kinase domain-containing protein n=1 Tax=viral metagenome TaxID=1070528 RepID=A0A6C0KUA9_9ZZZZ